MSNNYFAILGGMGSIATENFIKVLNMSIDAEKDQDFLNFILFNNASVPDRTEAILSKDAVSPLPELMRSIKILNDLDPDFIVMPCNSAHYYFDKLDQIAAPKLINMLDVVIDAIIAKPIESGAKIAVAATEGSAKSKIYDKKIEDAGYQVIAADRALQDQINYLIYGNVKINDELDMDSYYDMLDKFRSRGADGIILGCTELSVYNTYDGMTQKDVFDSDYLLALRTVELAKKYQNK